MQFIILTNRNGNKKNTSALPSSEANHEQKKNINYKFVSLIAAQEINETQIELLT